MLGGCFTKVRPMENIQPAYDTQSPKQATKRQARVKFAYMDLKRDGKGMERIIVLLTPLGLELKHLNRWPHATHTHIILP